MTEFEALIVSAAIEAPIAYGVVRLTRWPSRGPWHAAAAAAVATAVTHPQLWAAVSWLWMWFGRWPTILGAEAVVVLVEGVLMAWMAGLRLRHAMPLSLLTNGASFAAGLLIGG